MNVYPGIMLRLVVRPNGHKLKYRRPVFKSHLKQLKVFFEKTPYACNEGNADSRDCVSVFAKPIRDYKVFTFDI